MQESKPLDTLIEPYAKMSQAPQKRTDETVDFTVTEDKPVDPDLTTLIAFVHDNFDTGLIPSVDELQTFAGDCGGHQAAIEVFRKASGVPDIRDLMALAGKIRRDNGGPKTAKRQTVDKLWRKTTYRAFENSEKVCMVPMCDEVAAALGLIGHEISLYKGAYKVDKSVYTKFINGEYSGPGDEWEKLKAYAVVKWECSGIRRPFFAAWRELWERLYSDDFPLKLGMTAR